MPHSSVLTAENGVQRQEIRSDRHCDHGECESKKLRYHGPVCIVSIQLDLVDSFEVAIRTVVPPVLCYSLVASRLDRDVSSPML